MAVRARLCGRALAREILAIEKGVSELVRVAAAVILRPDGQVLLAQRPPGKPYEGYWEFPGGKLERGETTRHALVRELHEELGIDVRRASPWIVQEFVYPHAHVELNFFRVLAWDGEPHSRDGQAFAWQTPGAFDVEPLLPANSRVLAALQLPAIYAITNATDVGEDAFLKRASLAFERGLRMVQIREKDWPLERLAGFALQMREAARACGAKVLLNGTVDEARALGLDGVHLTSARLIGARSRPDDMIVGASCHDADELARAASLRCDFAQLGPVLATPTHPGVQPLGWDAFANQIEGTRIPVYALGGLWPEDLDFAIDRGAHGLAMRRGAW
jgi:8-oxo-dGTP diphosphatase